MKRRLSVLVLLVLLLNCMGERTDKDDARVLDVDIAANLDPNWKARDMVNALAMMVRLMR